MRGFQKKNAKNLRYLEFLTILVKNDKFGTDFGPKCTIFEFSWKKQRRYYLNSLRQSKTSTKCGVSRQRECQNYKTNNIATFPPNFFAWNRFCFIYICGRNDFLKFCWKEIGRNTNFPKKSNMGLIKSKKRAKCNWYLSAHVSCDLYKIQN